MNLLPQPGYTFVALAGADLDALAAHMMDFELYDVALNVGTPIDRTRLDELVAQQDVMLWRMDGNEEGQREAYACRSRYAMAEQVYVFCPEGWDNTAVAAGLEALTGAIFAAEGECQNIWTCLPLPEPDDSEDTLLIMGFTHIQASLDRGRRRTFGLSREVFSAYHEA